MSLGLKVVYVQSFILNPWTSWPFQAFPANEFKTLNHQELIKAREAWGFFQSVEAIDAATRIARSGKPKVGSSGIVEPDLWYELQTEVTLYSQYKYGQYLHTLVCPEILWDSQRHQGIPATPVTTLALKLTVPFPVNPTSIEAIANNRSANVLWLPPDNAATIASYTVTSSPGGFKAQGTSLALSAIVRGLTNGVSYTFTVTSTDIYGQVSNASAPSNAVIPYSAPSPPTITSAVAGFESAKLTWTAPSDNGGAPVIRYTIISTPGDVRATSTDLSGNITGLVAGTTYTFTVTATNQFQAESLPSAPSAPVIPMKIPDAPTSVRGTSGPASAILTWSSTATSDVKYSVKASAGSITDVSGLTGVTDISGLTTTVGGLLNGTAYVFRVFAKNSAGTSPASQPSNSVTPAAAPAAPVVTVVPGTNGYPLVSWPLPATNGSIITSYTVIVYNTLQAIVGTYNPAPATARSITLNELTYGSSYTCTVSATNAVGTSPPSARTAPFIPATIPNAPLDISATAAPGSATVTWRAPPSNGSAITGYTITTYNGIRSLGTTDSSGTTVTITSLTNGTAYTFVVVATNAIGTSLPSLNSNSVTPVTVPTVPRNIAASTSSGAALLTWVAPQSNGGAAITSYTVSVSPADAATQTITQGNALTATFTGLTNGRSYLFTVTAINRVGSTGASINVVTAGPPSGPVDLSGFAGVGAATVSWHAPTNLNGGSLLSYGVSISPGTTTFTNSPTDLSATFTGLTIGTSYTISVIAKTTGGQSTPSTIIIVPVTNPGPPTSVLATIGASGSINLSWVAPTVTGGAAIYSYTATSNPSGITATSYNMSTMTLNVPGLTNGQAYTFTVVATNTAGLSSVPSVATASITPATNPDPPTALNTTITPGNINATWTAPASNGGAAINYYYVLYSVNGGSDTPVSPNPTSASVNIAGVVNGSMYTISVYAHNSVGLSATYAYVGSIVIPTAPPAPTVSATANPDGTVAVSWSASVVSGWPTTGYTVTVSPSGGTITPANPNTGLSCTVSGLTAGTSRTFSVTATNAFGTGPAGTSSSVTTVGAPSAPTVTAALSSTVGSVDVSWSTPPANGATITGYTVKPFTGGSYGTAIILGLVNNYTVPGLTPGTSYTFVVSAGSTAGYGPNGTSNSVTIPFTAPSAPTYIGNPVSLAYNVNAGSPTVQLNIVGTVTSISYNDNTGLTYSLPGSSGSFIQSGTTYTVTYQTNGQLYGTSYNVWWSATNSGGTGGSSANSVPTIYDVPPSAPKYIGNPSSLTYYVTNTNFTVQLYITGNVTTITYNDNTGLKYDIPSGSGSFTQSGTTYTVTYQTNGQLYGPTYNVWWSATNAVSTGGSSANSVTTTYIYPTVPAAPTVLSKVNGITNNIEVSWNTPDSHGSTITGYNVKSYVNLLGSSLLVQELNLGYGVNMQSYPNPSGTAQLDYYVYANSNLGAGPQGHTTIFA